MTKAISIFGLTLLSAVYAIGFIYDSSYIEYFGVNWMQLFASPAEYLAIGGILIFKGVLKWFTLLFFLSGLVACAVMPVKEEMKRRGITRYFDIQSLLLILSSILICVLILYPGLIIAKAKRDAGNDEKMLKSITTIVEYRGGNEIIRSKGVVLRNRNDLVLLYDSDRNQSLLLPSINIIFVKKNP